MKWRRVVMSVQPAKILLLVLALDLAKLELMGAADLGLLEVNSPKSAEKLVLSLLAPALAKESASLADWKILKQHEKQLASNKRSLSTLEKNLDYKLIELKVLKKRMQ